MEKENQIFEDGMVADAGRAVLDAATDFTNEGKAIGEYVKIHGNTLINIQLLKYSRSKK